MIMLIAGRLFFMPKLVFVRYLSVIIFKIILEQYAAERLLAV